jgi:uncharacterized protein (TIGR02646 family)
MPIGNRLIGNCRIRKSGIYTGPCWLSKAGCAVTAGAPWRLENSHIEHFRPQHGYPRLELSYENLFASCLRALKPGLPLHCGHAKADDFDEDNHLSPLEAACESRFMYTQLGAILPADPSDARAKYMASLLAIDTPFLRDARAAVLNSVLDADFLATASAQELQQLRDAFRHHDDEGKLPEFGHVVARYAEQWLVGVVSEGQDQ